MIGLNDNYSGRVEVDFTHRQPLLTVGAVAWIARMDPFRVIQACEDGTFAWAFDLAEPSARKRSLRIWRGSVCENLKTMGRCGGESAAESMVLDDIIPVGRNPFSSEMTRRLSIHRTTLADFIDAGQVKVSGPAHAKYGIEAACKLERASLVKFLSSRRLGFCGARQLEAPFA